MLSECKTRFEVNLNHEPNEPLPFGLTLSAAAEELDTDHFCCDRKKNNNKQTKKKTHLPLQVRNIAVSHTFKINKAHQELGYCPKPYSLADSVEQYLKSHRPRSTSPFLNLSWSSQHLILLLLMGLSLVLLILSCIFCQS